MKRTPFKRKPKTAQFRVKKAKRPKPRKVIKKRSKRPKQPSNRILKDRLWTLCKEITRKRYGNICYTCGEQNLEGKNWQTGHGKPMGALSLRYQYDLRNLRPQCMRCNIHLSGQSDIFIAKLEQEPDGLAFLTESCVKEGNAWFIKRGELLGSIESTLFLLAKIEEYKVL